MPEAKLIDGVAGQCPTCHHAPIRHVEDGLGGATCLVCLWIAQEARRNARIEPHICTLKFEFKLSKREREQAERADKGSYPQNTTCAECYCAWRAHSGYLCPSGDSTFVPLLDSDLPYLVTK